MALDEAVYGEMVSVGNSTAPASGPHTPGRSMGPGTAPAEASESVGEMVAVGNSVAPASGTHEPSSIVAVPGNRSQTAAASDLGYAINLSNGEITVPTPGHISALPQRWAVRTMANSQPGFTFNPTLYNASLADRDLYHPGNPRTAKPGPESQMMSDQFPPAPGAPLGTRYGGSGRGGEGRGFFGRIVTKQRARKVLGPRKPKPRMFPRLGGR